MPFRDFSAAIRSNSLREVAGHWSQIKGSRRMPAWRDIDPVALAPHLPILWSWKYDAGTDSFTGRLAGEEINALFGKCLRGARMREFFPKDRFDGIFDRHKRVVTGPCFMVQRGLVFEHLGRSGSGERIILPLSADGVRGDGILGATLYQIHRGTTAPSAAADEIQFFPLD